MKKKILAKAKSQVKLRPLKLWAQSISNHMYWCAATSAASVELVKAKWLSLLNHIVDVHEGHSEVFPCCAHGDLDQDEWTREWLTEGSKCHKALTLVIRSPFLLRDIGKMSPYEQTAGLESFHKVVGFFAPKDTHFFYNAMRARYVARLLQLPYCSYYRQAIWTATSQGEDSNKCTGHDKAINMALVIRSIGCNQALW